MSTTRSTLRSISLPVHGAIEFVLGLGLIAAPIVVGAGTPAAIVGVVLGVLVVGLALTTGADPRTGRPASVSAHHSYDQGLALGGTGAAIVLALTHDGPGAVVILALTVGLFALSLATRYSAAR